MNHSPLLTLAIETSTMTQGVALLLDSKILSTRQKVVKRGHGSTLLASVDAVLSEHQLNMKSVDFFAIGLGPGSFTGLRVGLALLKGLAFASNRPIIGVSSLKTHALCAGPLPGLLCPIIDARKKEVYTGIYRKTPKSGPGEIETILEPCTRFPKDLGSTIHQVNPNNEPVWIFGEGLTNYHREITAVIPEATLLYSPQLAAPDPVFTGLLGLKTFLDQKEPRPEIASLEPIYIRASEAELKYKAPTP